MMKALLLCLLAVSSYCSAIPSLPALLRDVDGGSIWALLVAGSNTWMNYRHQADVCHAYQIFHAHGVPDDHIVVMMYDDIAHNEQNPDPGVVINHKGGPNVYLGVPHDYVKKEVTPENFLKVLQGKDMSGVGSGKTIKSGPDDHVFVNFVDHGAPGIVAFPEGELSAQKLNDAIKSMHQNQQYKQMVVYLEACEAGSMFNELLPKDINVYATTAANPHESSYACYYDSKLETYLGDVYSVKWMENVDQVGTNTESLEEQYEVVKNETTTSHVMQYGDLKFDHELLEVFMGSTNSVKKSPIPRASISDAVPSGDVKLSVLTKKVFSTLCQWEKRKHELQLVEELVLREKVRQTVEEVVRSTVSSEAEVDSILGSAAEPENFECLEAVVGAFSDQCFKLGQIDYALRHVYALVNLCEAGVPTATIVKAIDRAC